MFKIGDRVEHIKEPGIKGTIVQIDPYEDDDTTCRVVWDDGYEDIQWTNKLI